MGMFSNLRNIFKKQDNTSAVQQEDKIQKSILADEIVGLVYEIKKIQTFDRSLWNLSDASSRELETKSLVELEKIHATLKTRHDELIRQSQMRNPEREKLEATKWTGQKPENLTNHEFDRFQRDDR